MSNIGDILGPILGPAWQSNKPAREAVTQLYSLGIEKIIGEKPVIRRLSDKNIITWGPGQAGKMRQYITGLIYSPGKEKPAPSKEFSLNEIEIDMKPVMLPLAMQTVLPFMAVYTFLVLYISKKARRK